MTSQLTRRACLAGIAATPFASLGQERVPVPAFDLQGHRGTRGLRPENTLAAFRHALAIGVHTLELDIAITRDGVPVVAHDRRLNPDLARGPDGRYLDGPGPAIHALTLEELGRFDVGRIRPGSKYANDFAAQQPVDGERIPTLASLFDLVRRTPGADHIRFDIETKLSPDAPDETLPPEAFARKVISAVREAGMQHRSAIQSFDWRTLAVVQREAPELPTVYLTPPRGAEAAAFPRTIRGLGGFAWSAAWRDLTPALVQEARGLGLRVLGWTVNDPADMVRLIDAGVDGLITDYPDRARRVMQDRGMTLPPRAGSA